MKKKLFPLLFLLVIIGCNKPEELTNKNLDYKSEFISNAKLHNKAMSFIFKSLSNNIKLIQNDYVKNIEELSANFLKENNNFFSGEMNQSSFLKKGIDLFCNFRGYNSKDGNLKSLSGEEDFLLFIIEANKDFLSNAQIDLLYEIDEILDSNKSLDELINDLDRIQNIKCKNLAPEERNVIYAATTIGKESLVYWNENLDDWIKLIENASSLKSAKSIEGWFNWTAIAKDDLAGGVGGAIGGAIVGAAAGGVGAGPGAAAGFVGGAIGTSAADATMQLLNHLF